MKRTSLLLLIIFPFISLMGQEFDTIFDSRDGQQYQVVKIGDQWWMAENLKAIKYSDGVELSLVEDGNIWSQIDVNAKAYCFYNNSDSLGQIFGTLYTWAAAMNGDPGCNGANCTSSIDAECLEPVQGVCPDGWHLPSHYEWTVLLTEVEKLNNDFPCDESSYGYYGLDAGGHLKTPDTIYWNAPNPGSTNSSGFSALGSSYRKEDGSFASIGNSATYWTSTEVSDSRAWARNLYYDHGQVYLSRYKKKRGRSVRCVRDILSLDSVQIHKIDVSCNGYSDGALELLIYDEGTYNYEWSTGDTTNAISNLPAGTYSVSVSDSTGAEKTFTSNIVQPLPIDIEFITSKSCYGDSTGSISSTVTGGKPPYQYLWNNNSDLADLSGIQAGTYILEVTDSISCTLESDVVVEEYSQIVTGEITGQTDALPFTVYVYSVNQNPNSIYDWAVNGGNILADQGSNSINVQWGPAGIGYVSVTEVDTNGCIGDTVNLEIVVGSTGIYNEPDKSELYIFPNPTEDLITIKVPGQGISSVAITSLNGQTIYNSINERNTHQLNLSSFQKGVYFITIRSKDFVTTKKIIKY